MRRSGCIGINGGTGCACTAGPRRSRRQGTGRALLRAALHRASTPRVFTSTNESNGPMRALLVREGWTPAGVLTGLDEGDPEHVFFHGTPAAPGRP